MAKSLFSFASLRPGAKKNPFTYGAKLISQRLGKILYVLNFTYKQKKKQILCGKQYKKNLCQEELKLHLEAHRNFSRKSYFQNLLNQSKYQVNK